jgi:hypothetical protein
VENTERSHGTSAAVNKQITAPLTMEKGMKISNLGAEFIWAHENNYSTLVVIECTVQC